jgi:hypothetical protein
MTSCIADDKRHTKNCIFIIHHRLTMQQSLDIVFLIITCLTNGWENQPLQYWVKISKVTGGTCNLYILWWFRFMLTSVCWLFYWDDNQSHWYCLNCHCLDAKWMIESTVAIFSQKFWKLSAAILQFVLFMMVQVDFDISLLIVVLRGRLKPLVLCQLLLGWQMEERIVCFSVESKKLKVTGGDRIVMMVQIDLTSVC